MNKYANLSPEHSVAELQALVPKFSALSTQEKRKVFQSLQMTLVGQQAHVQVLTNQDASAGQQARIDGALGRVKQCEDMLKDILPQHFKREY